MVHIVDIKREEALKEIVKNKIICFGAGKRLEYFIKRNPEITIAGKL